MVVGQKERSGKQFSRAGADEFKKILDNLGLMDLALGGNKWTWTNQMSTSAYLRIDRFLISYDCLIEFSGTCQKVLMTISDHFPICIMSNDIQ